MAQTRVTLGVCLAVAIVAAAPVAAAPRPMIALVRTKPVQVRASGFQPGERVRVTVHADTASYTTATAGRDGRFDARVRGAAISHCHAFVITAAGAHGGHAVLRRRPQCPVRTSS
ncbi:hypothetical protein OM076_35945 [Solirubrobacter ginsenosidimutans]|uniref:Bacterial Ig domain-containing protein n=1 Tax=Solirubrobacter ginsenosidimutans TaxID=490573 RepID=A0A9X3N1R4_9ACTN|nr:hypothetical protein [Solirubrobacter ginsenosidimutans]MDA0165716.1 hypothetical protein [Solirubrobacter ginsenosidimutans]